MDKKRIGKLSRNCIAIAFIAILWIAYSYYSNTLITGFHFTDDHDFFRISNSIKKIGLWNTLIDVISQDLKIRFRPFYYAHRVLIIYLLRVDFEAFSLYNVVLAIITNCSLFLTARKLKFNLISSLIFPLIILVGPQMEIWYRKGPAETIGFTIFAFSLYFLIRGVKGNQKSDLIASIFLVALSSFSKESFAATIPAFLFLLVSLSLKTVSLKEIKKELFNKSPYIITLSLLLLLELYLVLNHIGTNKIGYAGVDNSTNIKTIVKVGFYFFCNSFILLFVSALFLFFLLKFKIDKNRKSDNVFYFTFIVLILLWLPQFFIYNKTFMINRYLLPSTIGIGILYLIVIYSIERLKSRNKILASAFNSIIIVLLGSHLMLNSLPMAEKFSKETVHTNILLNKLKFNAQKNDSIVIVMSASFNYEWGHSIKQYLNFYGYQKISFFTDVNYVSYNSFDKFLVKDFHEKFSNELELNELETMNKEHIIIFPFPHNEVTLKKFTKGQSTSCEIGEFIYINNLCSELF